MLGLKKNFIDSKFFSSTGILWIFFFASFFRLYNLSHHDLWFDEILSVSKAKWGQFFAIDLNPPLYFLFLRTWIGWFGINEFTVRLFSAITSILSVILMYKIGRIIFDRQTALISSMILSISPFHIWYAQEARAYSLFILSVLALVLFFILALRFGKKLYWIGTCLILVLNLYISYWTFLLLPGMSMVFFNRQYRPFLKRWLMCIGVGMLCFLPYAYNYSRQIAFLRRAFWIPKPVLSQIFITFENFNLGYTATNSLYLASWVVFGLPFIAGIISLVKNNKDILIFLLSIIFLPIIITFFIAQRLPIYLDRHLIAFSPFYYLILAYGLKNAKFYLKFSSIVVMLGMSLVSSNFYYKNYVPSPMEHHHGSYAKKPFKPISKFILEHKQPQDIVAFTNTGLLTSVTHYVLVLSGDLDIRNILPEQFCYFIYPEFHDRYWRGICRSVKVLKVVDISEEFDKGVVNNHLWLVSGSWARDYTLDENSIAVREFMERNYRRIFEKWFDGILIGLYEKLDN